MSDSLLLLLLLLLLSQPGLFAAAQRIHASSLKISFRRLLKPGIKNDELKHCHLSFLGIYVLSILYVSLICFDIPADVDTVFPVNRTL